MSRIKEVDVVRSEHIQAMSPSLMPTTATPLSGLVENENCILKSDKQLQVMV
ncbi:hypothetical protein Bpfe_009703, partial [Biomphalaria pfeifferi]